MSWGINFKIDIELSRMSFNNIQEVKDKIEENESIINTLISEIKMFAASNPRDIVPVDWNEQPIDWINIQINEKINSYNEYSNETFKLYCYVEYLEIENEEITNLLSEK